MLCPKNVKAVVQFGLIKRILQDWLVNHACQANHSGSSGSVEPTGIANIFKRSIIKNNLRCTNCIGDGDFSAFNTIKESKPYGDTITTKLEFVGHVQ